MPAPTCSVLAEEQAMGWISTRRIRSASYFRPGDRRFAQIPQSLHNPFVGHYGSRLRDKPEARALASRWFREAIRF